MIPELKRVVFVDLITARFVKASIVFLDPVAPEKLRVEVCESVYYEPAEQRLSTGWCNSFELHLPLLQWLRLKLGMKARHVFKRRFFLEGTVVRFEDAFFVVKRGCRETVNTSLGTAYVENLCYIDEDTFREMAEEVSVLFGIPKQKIDRFVLALYYSAKIGAAKFDYLPTPVKPPEIKEPKRPKTPEEKELEELRQKLYEIAGRVPPDKELEIRAG